ncbi:MAG: hypothetical protein M1820_005870 [Bogoriella megaspora]|nr:MAG: hypothetical protein M1820_005870 [Bogoriella megaspora]
MAGRNVVDLTLSEDEPVGNGSGDSPGRQRARSKQNRRRPILIDSDEEDDPVIFYYAKKALESEISRKPSEHRHSALRSDPISTHKGSLSTSIEAATGLTGHDVTRMRIKHTARPRSPHSKPAAKPAAKPSAPARRSQQTDQDDLPSGGKKSTLNLKPSPWKGWIMVDEGDKPEPARNEKATARKYGSVGLPNRPSGSRKRRLSSSDEECNREQNSRAKFPRTPSIRKDARNSTTTPKSSARAGKAPEPSVAMTESLSQEKPNTITKKAVTSGKTSEMSKTKLNSSLQRNMEQITLADPPTKQNRNEEIESAISRREASSSGSSKSKHGSSPGLPTISSPGARPAPAKESHTSSPKPISSDPVKLEQAGSNSDAAVADSVGTDQALAIRGFPSAESGPANVEAPSDAGNQMQENEAPELDFTFASVQDILAKYTEEMHDDHALFTKALLARARQSHNSDSRTIGSSSQDQQAHSRSPFASMKPIATQVPTKSTTSNEAYFTQIVWNGNMKFNDKNSKTAYFSVRPKISDFSSEPRDVPSYAEFVSLKQNVLAKNERAKINWPYLGDTLKRDEGKFQAELRESYLITIEDSTRQYQQSAQAAKYSPYVQSFLAEVGCSMDDVLRYLLEPILSSEIQVTQDVAGAVSSREKSCTEDFNRSSERWVKVLSQLPESSNQALAAAALACHVFLLKCNMSLWHVARHYVLEKWSASTDTHASSGRSEFRAFACRVCQLHDCPFHGEYQEGDEFDNAAEPIIDQQESLIHNRKVLVTSDDQHHDRYSDGLPLRTKPRLTESELNSWRDKTNAAIPEKQTPFLPCSHSGSCKDKQCSCSVNKVMCEKTCSCSLECERRFHGCHCAQNQRGSCKDQRCPCYRLNRECDPDLCGTCGATEILDPVNMRNPNSTRGKCHNVSIQLSIPKRTLLGHSEIHGFGLYAGEAVRKDELIGEYIGELISREEGDRRGIVAHHLLTDYLFTLTKGQDIDGSIAGNKIRFVNHSKSKTTRNCVPRILLCNTAVRIGLFAIRDIAVGEELFFDYKMSVATDRAKPLREKGEEAEDSQIPRSGLWRDLGDSGGQRQTHSRPRKRFKERAFLEKESNGEPDTEPVVRRVKSKLGGARPGAGRKPKFKRSKGISDSTELHQSQNVASASISADKGKERVIEESPDASDRRRALEQQLFGDMEDGDDGGPEEDDQIEDDDVEDTGQRGRGIFRPRDRVQDSEDDSDYEEDDDELTPRRSNRHRRETRKFKYTR